MPLFSPRHRFSEWPNGDIPAVSAGVYAIWEADLLIYCGMSGRKIEEATGKTRYGLLTRLESHASGRLSGDQFCVYVANRLVIPSLSADQLPQFADGEMTLDQLTKTYIRERLDYQYVILSSSSEAYALEKRCKEGHEFGVKPFLNPA